MKLRKIVMNIFLLNMIMNSFSNVSAINIMSDVEIESSIENLGGYAFEEEYKTVSNVKEGTTIQKFKETISNQYSVQVFRLDEEKLEGTIEVGMTVRLIDADSTRDYQVIENETLDIVRQLAVKKSRAGFSPRLNTSGMSGSPYWYSGLNPFYPNYGLPNCTAYAFGRLLELNAGKNVGVPTGNAGTWYGAASLPKGSTPQLGAIMCFSGGYGHVAVVEQIAANGDVTVSESNYGGSYFGIVKLTKASGYNNYYNNVRFQGFIYAYSGGTVTPPAPSGSQYANLDKVSMDLNTLNAGGWHITSKLQPVNPSDRVSNSRFLFVMDASTGRELARYPVGQYWRQDVANAYAGSIRNAGYGGFNLSVPMNSGWYGKKVYFMTRFASDTLGNQGIDDYHFKSQVYTVPTPKTINTGSIDKIQPIGNDLYVGGWHITSKIQPADPSHKASNSRYVFVIDAATGKELGRYWVEQSWRQDVANAYANVIHNAGYGGFSVSIPIKKEWSGKQVYVMNRYASNISGDQTIEDYHFSGNKVTLPIVK